MKSLYENLLTRIFTKWPDFEEKPFPELDQDLWSGISEFMPDEFNHIRFVIHKPNPKGVQIAYYGNMIFEVSILHQMTDREYCINNCCYLFNSRGLHFHGTDQLAIKFRKDPDTGLFIGRDTLDKYDSEDQTFTEQVAIEFIMYQLDS
jgi:hypothetical protein